MRRLVLKEFYWRNLLCMTWDFHTLQGPEQITKFIKRSSEDNRILTVNLDKSAAHKMPQVAAFEPLKIVQVFLKLRLVLQRVMG